MKRILLYLFLSVLSFNQIIAQDKALIAKSEFYAAEEAYNNGNYNKCLMNLEKSEAAAGNTYSIQYLRVKSLFNLEQFPQAQKAIAIYFEITPVEMENQPQYNEIVRLVSAVNEKVREAENIELQKALLNARYKIFIDGKEVPWYGSFKNTVIYCDEYLNNPQKGLIPGTEIFKSIYPQGSPALNSKGSLNFAAVELTLNKSKIQEVVTILFNKISELDGLEVYFLSDHLKNKFILINDPEKLKSLYLENGIDHISIMQAVINSIKVLSSFTIDQTHLINQGYLNAGAHLVDPIVSGHLVPVFNFYNQLQIKKLKEFIDKTNEMYLSSNDIDQSPIKELNYNKVKKLLSELD